MLVAVAAAAETGRAVLGGDERRHVFDGQTKVLAAVEVVKL